MFCSCWVYQADHRGLIWSMCRCSERFQFFFLSRTALGLSFGFGTTSACGSPSGVCSPPRRDGVKSGTGGMMAHFGGMRHGSYWLGHSCLLRWGSKGQWQTGAWVLALVGVPPIAPGAGAGVWGERPRWWPCPSCTTQHWRLPLQSVLPPGAFLAVEPLAPIPSGCLHAANSSPLLGSALQTPSFSTQSQPALANPCLRLGCPKLWHGLSVKISLCPTCHRPAATISSDSPWSFPPSQLIELPVKGPLQLC